jgi:hypothetical protein
MAAMAIGASLRVWRTDSENGDNIRTQRVLGTKYNYMTWELETPIFRWSKPRD